MCINYDSVDFIGLNVLLLFVKCVAVIYFNLAFVKIPNRFISFTCLNVIVSH